MAKEAKIKVNKEKLEKASHVFEQFGVETNDAFDLFLEYVIANNSLPFSVNSSDPDAIQNASFIRTAIEVLAAQCEYIYYINIDTNHYREFVAKSGYHVAGRNKIGDDFFRDTYNSIDTIIYEEDRTRLKNTLNKETVLAGCSGGNIFSVSYRMILKGYPEYYNLRAYRSADDSSYIIVEIRNVQKQYEQEDQYKKRIQRATDEARIDSLTHCYNYLAFAEEKNRLNDKIKRNDIDFALAMCDLNELKNINDSLGHLIGDQYLIEAAELIRTTFRHSKTYRVGGDEFVVILENDDFERRHQLIDKFKEIIVDNLSKSKPVVAIGLADVNYNVKNINDLFEIADNEMYKDKNELKQR